MTALSSSSTLHQTSVASNTTNNGSNSSDKSNKSYKLASNDFTVQRTFLGIHQNGALSNMESPYYTTAKQQVQKTRMDDLNTATIDDDREDMEQAGITDGNILDEDHDYYDEDDVEIIMHDDHYHHTDLPACTSAGLNKDLTPAASSPTATAPYQEQRQSDMDLPEALIDLPLQRQLEYYFSRQNLANDTYLVSQMDPDLYVPIATIAKFKRVLDLTSDMDHIVTTLRRSSVVTVDETGTKVKPNVSMQRTTVILRDVPDATEAEVDQFLQDINSLPIISIKNEYADMWYITFKSEDDALKMMYDTRGKLFKGQYVAARMKSEPVVGTIQARKTALQAGFSSSPGHAIGTHFKQRQHTYNHHTSMNMKNYMYNGPYHPSNSHTPYTGQYPSHHPSNSYSHYIPNGNYKGGRYMNNQVNNRNQSNSRRSNAGGRGWYKNNYGGMGRSNNLMGHSSTSWTDRQFDQSSSQNQRYQSQIATTNEQSKDTPVLINDVSEDPLTDTLSSPTLSQPPTVYRQNHYHQPSNYHRGNKNGRPGQWQHKEHSSSHQLGSNYSNLGHSNQRHKPSYSWKNGPVTPSTTPSLTMEHQSVITTETLLKDKPSEESKSSTTEHLAAETTTTNPVLSSASINTTTGSWKDQSSDELKKDATRNRRAKWVDKKKKNRKSLFTSNGKEHKHQEQPDLQSGTFFPPLPGTKIIDPSTTAPSSSTSSTKATEITVSSLLEKRLSIADIIKMGHESVSKQSPKPPIVIPESGPSKENNSPSQQAKTMPKDNGPTKKRSQPKGTSQNEDLFPLLCPVQDSPMPSSSFSYADMLKKKGSGAH